MDDEEAGCAGGGQQGAGGRHRGGEQRDVVAQALAEAAGLEEIALHVDDDEGRPRRIERQGCGFGVEKGLRGGHGLPRSDRARGRRPERVRAAAMMAPGSQKIVPDHRCRCTKCRQAGAGLCSSR
ncbi:hypothetical protein J2W79_001230 [Methylorubrum extorquens]|nr:hypothetical protein [Methylorubrum extorquens]